MKFIEFKGETIAINKVTSISKIKTIQTGSLQCDWDYGFTVNLQGNSIDFIVETETDSNGNHLCTPERRIAEAKKQKQKLIKLLNQTI
tara:strand:- start:27 stop:290 length:264 start_codon:yes stop_codon:yes gene_type:complete